MALTARDIPDGWSTVRLGDLGHFYSGLTGKSGKDFGTGSGLYIPFLNVIGNVVLRPAMVEAVLVAPSERQNIVRRGDLLFNGSSETPEEVAFACAVTEPTESLYLNSFCFGYRFNTEDVLDPLFFAYLSRSPQGRQVIAPLAQGSTRYNIAKTLLAKAEFYVPPIGEQRSIAKALLDASAWVDSLDSLIAKKRDVRNALLQRCFRGPSDLTPRGSNWSRVALGDVVTLEKGQLITEATSGNGNIPVIAGGLMPSYYTDRFNRAGRLISVSGSGANAGYVALRQGPLWASDCTTISESTNYDLIFLLAQLQLLQDKIYRAQTGGAQPHIHAVDLAPLVIHWCDLSSQIALGRVLMDIDAEIEALVSQRDKAELIRQGMAEDLLSGKVRLA